MKNSLFRGWVRHSRINPLRHSFSYRVFAVFLDIEEIATVQKNTHLFSYNRFNLFSFYDKDHGPRDGAPLAPWVKQQLNQHEVDIQGGKIFLFSMPRLLGYVFNPLSIFFCYMPDGTLGAIIYEVKNTHGEQHCYVVSAPKIKSHETVLSHSEKKVFFVSPFISMDASYRFRTSMSNNRLSVLIKVLSTSGDSMVATLQAYQSNLNDLSLISVFIKDPIMTVKVIAGIHYEALWLWIKRAPFYKYAAISSVENK